MLRFDENAPVTAPTDAATLLIARDASELELFFVRRHAQSAFLGGAVVFPGGKLDEADRRLAATLELELHPRATLFADDPEHARALAICACREAAEEAGILPSVPPLVPDRVEQVRAALEAGADLGRALESALGPPPLAAGHTLDVAALVPFAHWITPRQEQRRYDARFFLVPLPEGQVAKHDARETTLGVWASPGRMLRAFHDGDVFLAPPTLRSLELLCDAASVFEAIELCAAQSLLPICPEVIDFDPLTLCIPGDPRHDVAERRVAGPTRFVLRDGRLVSEDP